MTELSTRTFHTILKNQTDKRVSNQAAKDLRDEVEEYGKERANQLTDKITGEGRKTVKQSDVRETKVRN